RGKSTSLFDVELAAQIGGVVNAECPCGRARCPHLPDVTVKEVSIQNHSAAYHLPDSRRDACVDAHHLAAGKGLVILRTVDRQDPKDILREALAKVHAAKAIPSVPQMWEHPDWQTAKRTPWAR